jgi:transcriptional regulator with XRE-family HTH domain
MKLALSESHNSVSEPNSRRRVIPPDAIVFRIHATATFQAAAACAPGRAKLRSEVARMNMESKDLEEIDPRVLGARLQDARRSAGLTQQAVADQMEMARTTIVAIEKGDRRISSAELIRFAKLTSARCPTSLAGACTPRALLRNSGQTNVRHSKKTKDTSRLLLSCSSAPKTMQSLRELRERRTACEVLAHRQVVVARDRGGTPEPHPSRVGGRLYRIRARPRAASGKPLIVVHA